MIHKSDIINELKVYTAFFTELLPVQCYDWKKGLDFCKRTWVYHSYENSFLANKPIFQINKDECVLYDYSNLLTFNENEIDTNVILNKINIKRYIIGKDKLSLDKIKEILANNARAAIVAEKLQNIIEIKIELINEFKD